MASNSGNSALAAGRRVFLTRPERSLCICAPDVVVCPIFSGAKTILSCDTAHRPKLRCPQVSRYRPCADPLEAAPQNCCGWVEATAPCKNGGRWVHIVTGHRSLSPTPLKAFDRRKHAVQDAAARYFCQVVTGKEDRPFPVALEVTRGDLKTSSHAGQRTPWQVLGDIAKLGDCADLRLWHEWEQATQRVQAIRWSNGLRKAVGLGKEESDEEIVEAVVGGEVVYTFTELEWRALCRKRGARARVLRLAEAGGEIAVRRFMQELKAASPSIWPVSGAA